MMYMELLSSFIRILMLFSSVEDRRLLFALYCTATAVASAGGNGTGNVAAMYLAVQSSSNAGAALPTAVAVQESNPTLTRTNSTGSSIDSSYVMASAIVIDEPRDAVGGSGSSRSLGRRSTTPGFNIAAHMNE
jgi:hypothetical protein